MSADRLMPHTAADMPDLVSLTGMLWLLTGVMAARRSARSESGGRLAMAGRMADLLGHDGNHAWTGFGPPTCRCMSLPLRQNLGTRTQS